METFSNIAMIILCIGFGIAVCVFALIWTKAFLSATIDTIKDYKKNQHKNQKHK